MDAGTEQILFSGAVLGGARGPYLGQVATRCYVPDSIAGSAAGWNCMTAHYAMDDIVGLQVVLVNYYVVAGTGETNNPGTTTSTLSIKDSSGNVLGQGKWSGATSILRPAGSTIITDVIPVSIPKGTLFYTHQYQVNTSVICFVNKTTSRVINLGLSDGVNNTGVDGTMTNGKVVDNGGGSMVPPAAIIAYTKLPTIGTLGSSRMSGLKDVTVDATGNTGYTRLFGGNFAYIDTACGGDQIASVAGSGGAKRRALIQAYCSHLWLDPGLNDLNAAGKTGAQVVAILTGLAAAWPGGLAKTILNNEGPWTTSTDGWITTVNQTVKSWEAERVNLNTGIAALTGYNQVVNPASFDGNGTNGQFWNNPAVGGSQFTPDGIHENSATLIAFKNSSPFNPALITR